MKRKILVFVILCSFSVSALSQISPTPPADDQDVVKITTNLIQIDVTVTDKKGNIVKDLKPEDFEIFENNEKQEITNFSFVGVKDPPPIDKSAKSKPNKNAIPPPPPLQSKISAAQTRRTIAIVVDDLSMSFVGIFDARTAIRRFVNDQMQEGDLVAILRTGSSVGVLQQFTSDKQLLNAAIDRIKWATGARQDLFEPLRTSFEEEVAILKGATRGQSAGSPSQNQDSSSLESARSADEFRRTLFVSGTLGVIGNVIKGMKPLPGRKAVMLLSDGISVTSPGETSKESSLDIYNALKALVDQAVRSSVVIYTIDTKGLISPQITAEDNFISNGLSLGPDDLTERTLNERQQQILSSQQGLDFLSYQTGGISIKNQNFFEYGMAKIMRDQLGYYLIAYQPDDDTFDPNKRRFNRLSVRVKNRDDLRVRYRSGFFATTDSEEEKLTQRSGQSPQAQLLKALTSPFTQNEIDLRLTPLFVRDANGLSIRSFIHLKANDLKITKHPEGWYSAKFYVSAVVFGADGKFLDGAWRNETIKLKDSAYQDFLKNGFVYTVNLPLKKPGAYQFRAAVKDAETSKIGSAGQFVQVPNLKNGRLALSGLLIENFTEEEAQNGKKARNGQLQSDLQLNTSERRFQKGTFLRYLCELYNPRPGADLTLQTLLFKDGKKIASGAVRNISSPESASDLIKLPANMPLGDYVLQVVVRDPAKQGKGSYATQWIDFEIVN